MSSDEFYLSVENVTGTQDGEAVLSEAQPRLTIGRHPVSTVHVDNIAISRTHCLLHWSRKAGVVLVELEDASSFGTYVNGDKVGKGNRRQLQAGDVISNVSTGQTQSDAFTFTLHRRRQQQQHNNSSCADLFSDNSHLDNDDDKDKTADSGSPVFRKPDAVAPQSRAHSVTAAAASAADSPTPLFSSRPLSQASSNSSRPASQMGKPKLLVGKRLQSSQVTTNNKRPIKDIQDQDEVGVGDSQSQRTSKRPRTNTQGNTAGGGTQRSIFDYTTSSGRANAGGDSQGSGSQQQASQASTRSSRSRTNKALDNGQASQSQTNNDAPAGRKKGTSLVSPIEAHSHSQAQQQQQQQSSLSQEVPDSQLISEAALRAAVTHVERRDAHWVSVSRRSSSRLLNSTASVPVPLQPNAFGDVKLPHPDELSDLNWNYIHNCSVDMPLLRREIKTEPTAEAAAPTQSNKKNVKKFVKAPQGYHRHRDGRLPDIIDRLVDYRQLQADRRQMLMQSAV